MSNIKKAKAEVIDKILNGYEPKEIEACANAYLALAQAEAVEQSILRDKAQTEYFKEKNKALTGGDAPAQNIFNRQ